MRHGGVEMNLMSTDDLGEADPRAHPRRRHAAAAQPRGGIQLHPQRPGVAARHRVRPRRALQRGRHRAAEVLGAAEGEKIKPLRGLEESLKAGKALLRGSASAETTPASLNLGLGQPLEPPEPHELRRHGAVADRQRPAVPRARGSAAAAPPRTSRRSPTTSRSPTSRDEPPRASRRRAQRSGQFKVSGGLFEIETPDAIFRNVVLFERNPLVRVAAKRAFTKKNVKIFQYGSLEDVRNSMSDLFRSNSFFVTFLELDERRRRGRLMAQLKRKNPRLPVVLIDTEADLRRRHDLLRAGADLYLTKPSPARLQPGLAEEELSLFADELVLFAERSFQQWEQMTGGYGAEAARRFYELAGKDSLDRSFNVLKQLINELSNPNDISEVSQTILRLSAEYLERGALFRPPTATSSASAASA